MARKGYTGLQIGLHWVVASLVVFQYLAHDTIEAAWRSHLREGAADLQTGGAAYLHVACGLIILALALWRLWLRFSVGAPALPANEPRILRFLARATHFMIYALIIGMPVIGSIAWFAGVAPAAAAHGAASTLLLALVVLHVAGALFQQFVLKSDVLTRMVMTLD